MKRREFLNLTAKSLSLMALSDLINLNNAFAESMVDGDKFFVQVILSGGWDVTLGTDPWMTAKPDDKEMFIEYDPSSISRVGNIAFGPSFEPMREFANNMSVINGIFLSGNDNGHEAAMHYMQSGSVDTLWGSLAVEYGECRGEEFLGLISSGTVLSGSRTPITTPTSNLTNMQLAKPTGFGSKSARQSKLDVVAQNMQTQAGKFARRQEILDILKSQNPTLNDKHQMTAAMSAGLALTALYEARSEGGGLDTHSTHENNHKNSQLAMWNDVKDLINTFKGTPYGQNGDSLYDHTTFFITSEFGRTAALNMAGGKDHNPLTNSAVIISSKVRSASIGGSHLVESKRSATRSSYHVASPIDIQTGRPLKDRNNAFIVTPENVAATVAELMGISRKRFAPVKSTTPSLTHLIRR